MTNTTLLPAETAALVDSFATADTIAPEAIAATEYALCEAPGAQHATALLAGLKAFNANLNPMVATY